MAVNLEDIKLKVQKGDAPGVKALVEAALKGGDDPKKVFYDGLIAGMKIVIDKFKRNEAYIPEVLIAARANDAGMALVKPYLAKTDFKPRATIVVGTVKGDLHDIGKNLVGMSFRGQGYNVVDLGVDQSPENFVKAAKDNKADIIGLSALLTTTMPQMKGVVEKLKAEKMKTPVIIGGAPVTQDYADEIGATGYAPDAATAVEKADKILKLT
jgi:5-methyltetrahydrofolate--homocysteine methyltransferase